MYNICSVDASHLAKKHYRGSNGLLRGCLQELIWVRQEFQPSHIYLLWDGKGSHNLRKAIRDNYKEGRKTFDEQYYKDRKHFKQLMLHTDVKQYVPIGAEADDGFYSITRNWKGPHLIYTIDKDMFQLVSSGVSLYRTVHPPKLYCVNDSGESTIELGGTEITIQPEKFIYYQALMGDPVDNIPGCPGIGPKRAVEILAEYPNLVDTILHGDAKAIALLSELVDTKGLGLQVAKVLEHAQDVKDSYNMAKLYEVEMEEMEATPDRPVFKRKIIQHGLEDLVGFIGAFYD